MSYTVATYFEWLPVKPYFVMSRSRLRCL